VGLEIKTTEGCGMSLPLWSLCGVNSGSKEKKMLARLREIVVSVKKTVYTWRKVLENENEGSKL